MKKETEERLLKMGYMRSIYGLLKIASTAPKREHKPEVAKVDETAVKVEAQIVPKRRKRKRKQKV